MILANIQGITYYVKTLGVVEGFKMYKYLGISNLPDSVITWIQWDLADGNSSLDDLIGANIPINQRGDTGEQELSNLYGGVSQVYFPTELGGRFIDQFADDIAHESKVGFTCLSKRVQIQVMKDAWLLGTYKVDRVVWHFFRSEITGKIGATQNLMDLLTRYGIEYIIHIE